MFATPRMCGPGCETGMGIGSVARGLVALAEGASSLQHAEAFNAWAELIRGRKLVTLG